MRFIARRLFLVGAVLAALAMLMTSAIAGANKEEAIAHFARPAVRWHSGSVPCLGGSISTSTPAAVSLVKSRPERFASSLCRSTSKDRSLAYK